MGALVVRGGAVLTPWQRIEPAAVVVEDGVIAGIRPGSAPTGGGERALDATGCTVVPGFVDLQVNGTGGVDCMLASVDDLVRLCRLLPRFGCTSFLPTLVTASGERLRAALSNVAALAERQPEGGARPLGAHLEGPYLSQQFKGAHDPAQVRPFDADEWRSFVEAARGSLRLVTVAPDMPGNEAAVPAMRRAGCVVSLGHSNATYEEARAAALAGASMATHTWNAMRPLHHREPGLPGAALSLDDLTAAVIPDGIHVHPALVGLLVRAKGPDRVAAVTDAVAVAGLPPGTYRWEGRDVRYDGRAPRLADGTLAGSGATADGLLRTLVSDVGLPLSHAVRLLSTTPARLLGLERHAGALRPGAWADLVVLDDDLRVVATLVRGEVVYHRDSENARG